MLLIPGTVNLVPSRGTLLVLKGPVDNADPLRLAYALNYRGAFSAKDREDPGGQARVASASLVRDEGSSLVVDPWLSVKCLPS